MNERSFGIGARVTLNVMSDDYVRIILNAIATADASGLDVVTGDVSTFVSGAEVDIMRYLSQLISHAALSGAHVSATVQLSRGCPGEVVCDLPEGFGPWRSEIPVLETTGIQATAEWALYPLNDTVVKSVVPDHMRDIYAAIDLAKHSRTFVGSEHFVTRLQGDIADILHTMAAGWITVGRTLQHVTTHLTLSANSPTPAQTGSGVVA
jgi:hypothetical protein